MIVAAEGVEPFQSRTTFRSAQLKRKMREPAVALQRGGDGAEIRARPLGLRRTTPRFLIAAHESPIASRTLVMVASALARALMAPSSAISRRRCSFSGAISPRYDSRMGAIFWLMIPVASPLNALLVCTSATKASRLTDSSRM